jgi:hypothetical protein
MVAAAPAHQTAMPGVPFTAPATRIAVEAAMTTNDPTVDAVGSAGCGSEGPGRSSAASIRQPAPRTAAHATGRPSATVLTVEPDNWTTKAPSTSQVRRSRPMAPRKTIDRAVPAMTNSAASCASSGCSCHQGSAGWLPVRVSTVSSTALTATARTLTAPAAAIRCHSARSESVRRARQSSAPAVPPCTSAAARTATAGRSPAAPQPIAPPGSVSSPRAGRVSAHLGAPGSSRSGGMPV